MEGRALPVSHFEEHPGSAPAGVPGTSARGGPAAGSFPASENATDRHAAAVVLRHLLESLKRFRVGEAGTPRLSLKALPAASLRILEDALGQGEVSAVVAADDGGPDWRVRETAFAGIWRVQRGAGPGSTAEDDLEADEVPDVVRKAALRGNGACLDAARLPVEALNARPVVSELRRHAADVRAGWPARVLNLSLLPLTAADFSGLDNLLGEGPVAIASRSFGNCRITSTKARGVWRVRYCNSMNAPVVDTLEVVDIPEAARAAAADCEASLARLQDLLDWLREGEALR